jgi:hypothetical protein
LLTEKAHVIQALTMLERHLTPEGILMMDLATYRSGRCEDSHLHPDYFNPEVSDGQLVEEWTRTSCTGVRVQRSRVQHRLNDSKIRVDFHYKIQAACGKETKRSAYIEMRCYTYDQFVNLAKQCNLVPREVYRNYAGAPYEADAIRMIFLVQRA